MRLYQKLGQVLAKIKIFQRAIPWSPRAEFSNLFRNWSTPKQRISHLCHGFNSGAFYKCVWECHIVGRGSRTFQSTFRWMVVWYTATTSVGWRKNFSFNMPLNSGLFIDSSKVSLKAVLKHNGNNHPSIPLAHAVHMKESYASIQGLLKKNITKATSGAYVLTGRLWQCWLSCEDNIRNFFAFLHEWYGQSLS